MGKDTWIIIALGVGLYLLWNWGSASGGVVDPPQVTAARRRNAGNTARMRGGDYETIAV